MSSLRSFPAWRHCTLTRDSEERVAGPAPIRTEAHSSWVQATTDLPFDLPSPSLTSTLRTGEDLRVIGAAKPLLPPRSTIEQPCLSLWSTTWHRQLSLWPIRDFPLRARWELEREVHDGAGPRQSQWSSRVGQSQWSNPQWSNRSRPIPVGSNRFQRAATDPLVG